MLSPKHLKRIKELENDVKEDFLNYSTAPAMANEHTNKETRIPDYSDINPQDLIENLLNLEVG